MSISAPTAYHDLQGLTSLRAGARAAPAENIKEVAAQFESIFFQMMLKSMRDATVESDLFSSDQMDSYQQMFDQQLSLDLSRQGGLGLAQILMEQLGEQAAPVHGSTPSPASGSGDMTRLDIQRQVRSLSSVEAGPAPTARQIAGVPLQAAAKDVLAADDWQPSTPEEFIQGIWEHAVDAAAELGVDPAVLVAQSALETGWGKKVIKTDDGSSSFNLFGIKASGDWQGRSAAVNTVEYRDGVAAMERAAFRAYDSLAGAFRDYVEFLKDSPRYQPALDAAGDGRGFLSGLQSAGYATDPEYADKIMNILDDGSYSKMIRALKNPGNLSLSG